VAVSAAAGETPAFPLVRRQDALELAVRSSQGDGSLVRHADLCPYRALGTSARGTAAQGMSEKEDGKAEQVETLLATPDLADALESEQFRRFLDQVPIAIIVSEIKDAERIVYANPEFEKLTGQVAADLVANPWSVLKGRGDDGAARGLGEAIADSTDFVATFQIERAGQDAALVDAYSNVILNDDGKACYRLAALVDVGAHGQSREEFERAIREKDTLLLEVQHRVKNNLQMIVALMRIEARNARGRMDTGPFDRLAGRIESIQHLYALLADLGAKDEIDLGVYLSKIASSVLSSHAVEGIRLDLKVDAYPVSVNVAMPTGLVVNELLTNALKHAFVGRDSGAITLNSLSDGNGCRIIIADNGVGLPTGTVWPERGKLSALIVQSLRENAKASVETQSSPGNGTRTTIVFTRAAAAPEAAG
jgi:two-component sensor histidine kinase